MLDSIITIVINGILTGNIRLMHRDNYNSLAKRVSNSPDKNQGWLLIAILNSISHNEYVFFEGTLMSLDAEPKCKVFDTIREHCLNI